MLSLFIVFFLYFVELSYPSGNFEVQLVSFIIDYTEMENHCWCKEMEHRSGCEIYLSFCLKEPNGNMTMVGECFHGNITRQVEEKEHFLESTAQTPILESLQAPVKLPFTYAWTVSLYISIYLGMSHSLSFLS